MSFPMSKFYRSIYEMFICEHVVARCVNSFNGNNKAFLIVVLFGPFNPSLCALSFWLHFQTLPEWPGRPSFRLPAYQPQATFAKLFLFPGQVLVHPINKFVHTERVHGPSGVKFGIPPATYLSILFYIYTYICMYVYYICIWYVVCCM